MRFARVLGIILMGLFSGSVKSSTAEIEFWEWFVANEASIFKIKSGDDRIANKLYKKLQKIDEDLSFEVGSVENGSREFVISAGGMLTAFPAVERLYQAAPVLDRWIWVKFRPRGTELFDVSFNDETVSAQDVRYLLAKDGNKPGIIMFFEGLNDQNRDQYGHIGFIFLDHILGEYAVVNLVGFIEFHSFDSKHIEHSYPLSDLQGHFDEFQEQNR